MKTSQSSIVIKGMGSISALGSSSDEVRRSYELNTPQASLFEGADEMSPIFRISAASEQKLQNIKDTYPNLDRVTHLALFSARQVASKIEVDVQKRIGVSVGSARGATTALEHAVFEFYLGSKKLNPSTSPTTSSGMISATILRDLKLTGIECDLAVTCSSGLHALGVGVAHLKAGFADQFIVGGTEAPLTPFGLAQLKALRIYSSLTKETFPCQPFAVVKQNTLVLGEGAAMFLLERVDNPQKDELIIEGIGFGAEAAPSVTAITADGQALQRSMINALNNAQCDPTAIDTIIAHSPGTYLGDCSEEVAIGEIFSKHKPRVITTKHLSGHTFGASGALSIELACLCLQGLHFQKMPYETRHDTKFHAVARADKVLVNSIGFGNSAVSAIISRI